MKHWLAALLIALPLLALNASAQTSFPTSGVSGNLPGDAPQFLPVEQAYELSPRLDGNRLYLDWRIAPGYYLYQEQFRVTNGTETLSLEFESGDLRYDEYYDKELIVYYGSTRVIAELPATATDPVLKVRSQGCADAGLCYPPRDHYLQLDLETGSVVETSPTEAAAPPPAETPTSLPLILGFALLGGLILNLMPCVFPVLSIKALGLANTNLGAHGRHQHGLAYTAGVVTTFVLVAVVLIALRSGGEALGWGFQLQSPLFITILTYLFFVMGLSFSGYFEAGARLMNVGQAQIKGQGLPQSFGTGVLAAVVASPCSAPFMGTALGVALTQPPATALLIFIFLGLGMALPFLLLSWAPGLASRLPKPGPWMVTFKEVLAFPLYLTCIWLLWVLGRQAGPDSVATVLCGLVLIAFALWLIKSPGRVRQVLAGVAVIVALATTLKGINPDRAETNWEPYSAQRLETLLDQRQPVFINLTASWCITCLANERVALSSDTFSDTLRQEGITYLKGDWTNADPEITALLQANGRNGVPLYLFYRAGERSPQILPQILSEALVTRTLRSNP